MKFGIPLHASNFGKQQLADGGDDGIRTHDPLLAGQVLSQLSYTPIDGIPSVSPFRSLKIEQQFDVPFKTRSRPSGFCLPIYKLQ